MEDAKKINLVKRSCYNVISKYYELYAKNKNQFNKDVYKDLSKLYNVIANAKTIADVKNFGMLCQNSVKDAKNSTVIDGIIEFIKATDSFIPLNDNKIKDTKKDNNEVINKSNIDVKVNSNDNDVVVKLKNLQNKINDLNNKIYSSKNEEERTSYRVELSKLLSERKNLALSNTSYDYSKLWKLESLERMYFMNINSPKNDNIKPISLSSSEYTEMIKDTLKEISALDRNSKNYRDNYNNLTGRYHNLIASVYQSESANISKSTQKEDVFSTNDLISYVQIYNLDGNYNTFKNNFNAIKVGNKEIDKSSYDRTIKSINIMIEMLCYDATRKIETKGGNVTIVNSAGNTDKLKRQIDNELNTLYNSCKVLGESVNVHR